MSLTPAMLARLAKRGILSSQDDGQTDAKGVDFDRSTLPNNWEEVIDENTGYPYYWNTDNNHVQWEPPTQEQINAPSSVQEHPVESHHKETRSHHKSHNDRTVSENLLGMFLCIKFEVRYPRSLKI